MKSEIHIIIWWKLLIKIWEPLLCFLLFLTALVKKKNSSVCFVIFFSFHFLNAPIAITIEIQFMFFGIFWALLRAHFNPYLTAWAKMSLSLAQKKHFYACKHKLSVFNLGCVFASFTRNILFWHKMKWSWGNTDVKKRK